jgi:hypothetical protein
MLVKKVPSLYRRRRALVLISSLFGRMVTERIARFAQLDTKARPEFFTYRLRLLPNRHFGAPASYDSPLYKNERQLFPELAGESPFIERLLWRNDKVTLTQL